MTQPKRFVIEVSGRYGAIDLAGNIAIEPRFEFLGEFSEGLACFKEAGRFGFVDTAGHAVLEPKWVSTLLAGPRFSGGLAAIGVAGQLNYIDTQGSASLPGPFYFATDFKDGLAFVQRSSTQAGYEIIDRTGAAISKLAVFEVPFGSGWPRNWDSFACLVEVDGRLLAGHFNSRGECLFAPKYPLMTNFENGVAGFCEHEGYLERPFGLVALSGEVLKSPAYFGMGGFEEGLASAGKAPREFGFINTQGDWVIEPQYRQARPFSEGLACVTVNQRKGFINVKGDMVIEPRFDHEAEFKNGLVLVEFEGFRAYIDPSGKTVWKSEKS